MDAEDDAATANWGSDWRMPTKDEFDELLENTTSSWTQVDGVNGVLFTSTANTNTLFFPCVGSVYNGDISGYSVFLDCWSVSLADEDVSKTWKLSYFLDMIGVSNGLRCVGCSVRPVKSLIQVDD